LDKTALTLIALWFHVPFVTAWIGLVMFDLFAAVAPGLETSQRARMLTWSRPFVVLAIVVILATGIWQTVFNPFFEVTSYETLERLRTNYTYGMLLFWKHGFVLATFVLTWAVRFVLAPRLLAVAVAGGGAAVADEERILRSISWIAAANLLACLGALLLATRMVWELH
jgi:hypothetical protein